MIERILLAIDDSPDSPAAVRLAIKLSDAFQARLRIVHARPDHSPAAGLLTRAAAQAAAAGVESETAVLDADADAVLDHARQWQADMVVVGKAVRAARREPSVASQVRHLLEAADQPVLVVPS